MRFTQSLKKNSLFRRAYRAKSAVGSAMVVYVRKNNTGKNRLGFTVSTKLGKAVFRNRARRRLREAYRLEEASFRQGYDIVIVARHRAATLPFVKLREELRRLMETATARGKNP